MQKSWANSYFLRILYEFALDFCGTTSFPAGGHMGPPLRVPTSMRLTFSGSKTICPKPASRTGCRALGMGVSHGLKNMPPACFSPPLRGGRPFDSHYPLQKSRGSLWRTPAFLSSVNTIDAHHSGVCDQLFGKWLWLFLAAKSGILLC